MHIVYFDEAKPNPGKGINTYIVAGVAVPIEVVPQIEKVITDLAVELFKTSDLVAETEFHGSNIYYKKGPFKNLEPLERVSLLKKFALILEDKTKLKKVYACIKTDQLFEGVDPAEHAFMHFVERVDTAIGKDGRAILIGDLDDSQCRSMVKNFQKYRTQGTNSKYGKLIDKIVDSVNFCRSHHSRMIQLADIYTFIVAKLKNGGESWIDKKLFEEFQGIDLFPDRYKNWPNR